jgi:disulfide bond formation protein DsbB
MSTDTMSLFFALLTVTANLVVIAVITAAAWARLTPLGRGVRDRLTGTLQEGGLALAWLAAVCATLGSLYYSEIAGFVPCQLCWYQRIAMYPLAVILGVAVLTNDRGVRRYVLPLAGIGLCISAYHYLVQWFPQLETGSCAATAPCAAFYVREFGFISIPFMAFSAFALIITSVWTATRTAPQAPASRLQAREEESIS